MSNGYGDDGGYGEFGGGYAGAPAGGGPDNAPEETTWSSIVDAMKGLFTKERAPMLDEYGRPVDAYGRPIGSPLSGKARGHGYNVGIKEEYSPGTTPGWASGVDWSGFTPDDGYKGYTTDFGWFNPTDPVNAWGKPVMGPTYNWSGVGQAMGLAPGGTKDSESDR